MYVPIFSVVENDCGIAKEHNAKRNNGGCEETEPKGVGRDVGPVRAQVGVRESDDGCIFLIHKGIDFKKSKISKRNGH